MKIFLGQRFLTIYSGLLTLVFAVTLLSGFSLRPKATTFDEISVRRINVIEPDGTLRMVISDHAKLPGIISEEKSKHWRDLRRAFSSTTMKALRTVA
jgi:hypothetical protein